MQEHASAATMIQVIFTPQCCVQAPQGDGARGLLVEQATYVGADVH